MYYVYCSVYDIVRLKLGINGEGRFGGELERGKPLL